MPQPEASIGRTFLWTISCILFICVTIGAGCLLVYIISPASQSSNLLPILGFILVCMPWIFWIVTIIYRITSRAFGFRMVAGNLYGNSSSSTKNPGDGSAGGGGTTVGDKDIDGADILDTSEKLQSNSPKPNSSTSSNDISIISHESEMPLSSSKAS
ncbi:hypothetical protein like AT4G30770 [Hibiscus trionum]|uniref:Membrane lipoprotein n=1 Tax=Hibiscus trionum TaxID=183268 RepID=A0A9W7IWF3_HIBTR|nr:hypothetical protein like AT4G30770 [Hibiscus trionum]